MPYSQLPIGQANPGLIVILLDQSQSMEVKYHGLTRAAFAALAVNRCIYNILLACTAGEKTKDRCHIGVIGYGNEDPSGAKMLVAGRASQISGQMKREERLKKKEPDGAGGLVEVDHIQPIWVDPEAIATTPMDAAFNLASVVIEAWTRDNPRNFPPIVINVTDGAPNDEGAARTSAQRLMALGTADGTTLLFNAHIGDEKSSEIKLPASDAALPNKNARFLYEISSPIPPTLTAAAELAFEMKLPAGSRGFVMNAGAETLTKLIVFGSTPMTSTRRE